MQSVDPMRTLLMVKASLKRTRATKSDETTYTHEAMLCNYRKILPMPTLR